MTRALTWIDPAGAPMSLSYDDTADVFAGMDVQVAGMPPVRASSDPVPLQSGARWRQVDYGPRDVDVPVLITAVTLSAVEQAVDDLTAAVDPTRGDGRIQIVRHDGSVRELTCRYIGGFTITEATNIDPVWAAVLTFQAADPFWSDTSDISVTVTLGGVLTDTPPVTADAILDDAGNAILDDAGSPLLGSGEEVDGVVGFDATIDFDQADASFSDGTTSAGGGTVVAAQGFFPFFPLRLGASELSQLVTIVNSGRVPSWPVWTIVGPISGVVVENETTGERFELTVDVAAGDTLTIDTRPGHKSITNTAGVSVFPITGDSSLWALLAGTNVISVTFSGSTAATSITARWRRRWLTA